MTHIIIKSIFSIKVNIFITNEVSTELTEFGNYSANKSHGSSIKPIGREHIIDAKQFASINDQLIVIGNEDKQVRGSSVESGHWTKSQEKTYFACKVVFVMSQSIEHLSGSLRVTNINKL